MNETNELMLIEACAACLEDDAAQMLADNPEDERAKNMQDAARLLEQMYEALDALLGYFRSGNEIAVDRAVIQTKSAEVQNAIAALKAARGEQ